MIGCKGSSGIKPCLMCRNVFLKGEVRDIVASDRTGVAVHHSEPNESNLQPMTMRLLEAICARLREGADIMNQGDFKELEKRLGWNWDPGLHERILKLRPLVTVMFDWMHCIFVNGTYNVLVYQMFRLLKTQGVTWARADSYFRKWTFPGCVKCCPDTYAIFGEKRAKAHWEGKHFKCTASEGLATMQVSGYASHIRMFWARGYRGVRCSAWVRTCVCVSDCRVSSGRSASTTLHRPRW